MCGPDLDRDSTSLDVPAEDFTAKLGDSIEGLRIGVPAEFFGEGLSADVRTAVDAALKEYEKLGAVGAHQPALYRAVCARVLHPGTRGSIVQPVAL